MIEVKGITLPVVVIKVKERGDSATLLKAIREKLSSKLFEGSYFLIDTNGLITQEEAQEIERLLSKGKFKSVKSLKAEAPTEVRDRLLVIKKHLRSGQRVEHSGDVLVLGDVNKDAQVIASGNIIVMGKLRGVAFAGALGDESAVVVAMQMQPQQIRIGRKVAIMSDEERTPPDYPELAKVEGDHIVLEAI